jgi:hypothetical protein
MKSTIAFHHARAIAALIAITTCAESHATPIGDTLIGSFTVSYRFNSGGLNGDANPFHLGSIVPPGPIQIDASPGQYRADVMGVGSVFQGGGFLIWSGNAITGTVYTPGQNVGNSTDFLHTHGQIVLYYNDWIASDNSANDWRQVDLYRVSATGSVPDSANTFVLLSAGLLGIAAMHRRRCFSRAV